MNISFFGPFKNFFNQKMNDELKLFLDFLRFYRIKISPFKEIFNKKNVFYYNSDF